MSKAMVAIRLAAVAGLVLIFAGCPPPPKAVEVFGSVLRLGPAPLVTISGATVVVQGVGQATSDSEGEYSIEMPPGSHVFSVTASGYQPFELTVDIPDVPLYRLDLWLEPI